MIALKVNYHLNQRLRDAPYVYVYIKDYNNELQ